MKIAAYAIMKSQQFYNGHMTSYITTVDSVRFDKILAELDCELLNAKCLPEFTYFVQDFEMDANEVKFAACANCGLTH